MAVMSSSVEKQSKKSNQTRLNGSRLNQSKWNLFLDVALAGAFVLVLEEHFTGLNWHELIGVGFAIGLLVHFILHWRWVFTMTKTFFRKLFHESRLNYLLNLVLLVDLAVIIVTGIGISRTLGLELGLDRSLSSSFEQWHRLASNFSLLLVGLHVAIHWKWIVSHARRYIFRNPFRFLLHRQAPHPVVAHSLVTTPIIVTHSTQQSQGGQS